MMLEELIKVLSDVRDQGVDRVCLWSDESQHLMSLSPDRVTIDRNTGTVIIST